MNTSDGVMWVRIIGLTLLIVGGALLFSFEELWVRAVAGSAFIAGFFIFALDLMRRSFLKDTQK